jgi:hypothetical protein
MCIVAMRSERKRKRARWIPALKREGVAPCTAVHNRDICHYQPNRQTARGLKRFFHAA